MTVMRKASKTLLVLAGPSLAVLGPIGQAASAATVLPIEQAFHKQRRVRSLNLNGLPAFGAAAEQGGSGATIAQHQLTDLTLWRRIAP
jgi:hypothetical protein